jgi:hypothetical protein
MYFTPPLLIHNPVIMNRLGVISTNPLKVTKGSPVPSKSSGGILVDATQVDNKTFDLTVTDEDGQISKYTVKLSE